MDKDSYLKFEEEYKESLKNTIPEFKKRREIKKYSQRYENKITADLYIKNAKGKSIFPDELLK